MRTTTTTTTTWVLTDPTSSPSPPPPVPEAKETLRRVGGDKDVVRLLHCDVDSFRDVYVPPTDSFYAQLSPYSWFNSGEVASLLRSSPIKPTSSPRRLLVPRPIVNLLHLAYLLPPPPPASEQQAATTLDQGFLTVKLMMLQLRSNHQRRRRVSLPTSLVSLSLAVGLLLLLAWMWQAFPLPRVPDMVMYVMNVHAPLGIKLNPQVDFLIGNFVLMFLYCWDAVLLPVVPVVVVSEPPAVVAAIIGGAVGFILTVVVVGTSGASSSLALTFGANVLLLVCGLAYDSATLGMMHVTVLHRLLSKIMRFQLSMLRTCLLLMRGRKVNVLKHQRVDRLHTDSALLILGTMTTFFLVFTLQTTVTYHLLLLSWALSGFAVKCALHLVVRLAFLAVGKSREEDGQAAGGAGMASTRLEYRDGAWFLCAMPHSVSIPAELRALLAAWWTSTFASVQWTKVLQAHELPSGP